MPVDVRVLDRDGKPVADLQKDDFAITEDGVPQNIRLFERQALTAMASVAAAPVPTRGLKPQNRRVFLIVLGPFEGWLPHSRWGLRTALTKFVRERLLPQDYVAFCAWGRSTDLTTNHEAVAQVMERLEAYQDAVERRLAKTSHVDGRRLLASFWIGYPPGDAALEAGLNEAFGPATSAWRSPTVLLFGRDVTRLLERVARDVDLLNPDFQGAYFGRASSLYTNRARHTWNIFTALAFAQSIEGEKHLIYFGNVSLPDVDEDRDLARIASDARVAIDVVTGSFDVLQTLGAKHVAQLTGGQAILNQYPDRALARIEQATRTGYLLGYYPTNPTLDGKFRKIAVRVKRPSGATVLYRHMYQATDQPIPYDQRPFIAQERIMAVSEYEGEVHDLSVTLKATAKKGAVTADAVVDLPRIALKEVEGRRVGIVELAFFCTDSRDRLVGQVWHRLDLKLKEETYVRALAEGLRHSASVPVTGAARYVKVVVYDYQSERIGSAIVRLPQ